MKIKGKPIARETRRIVIERSETAGGPLELTVASITMGTRRDFDTIWPRPKVPLIVTEGKKGREEKENWRDEKFQIELDERAHAQNVYLLYKVLEHDTNVVFDNKPTDIASMKALVEEVKNSNLSEGDMVVILREAMLASNISQKEIDDVKSSF